jgi:hypothetical protein
VKGVIEGN